MEWRTLSQVQRELDILEGQAVFLGTILAATVRKCIQLGGSLVCQQAAPEVPHP